MRTKAKIIIDTLYMYFVNNSSTRAISNFFLDRCDYYVSHVSIYKWIHKFAHVFKQIALYLAPTSLNQSDEWHADETVIKIKGKKFYIWTLIDSEIRFVIYYHLTQSREATEAFALFNTVEKKHGAPLSILSDRLLNYTMPVKTIFSKAQHIKVQKFSDDIINNLIDVTSNTLLFTHYLDSFSNISILINFFHFKLTDSILFSDYITISVLTTALYTVQVKILINFCK